MLPLLDKIKGKTLHLKDYTLSIEHCLALSSATKTLNFHLINRVFFENCGIDDKGFSKVIEAL